MNEVSCRAFTYFTAAEARGLLDVSRLLAGLSVTRAELEEPSRRVDWELWAELCDRAAAQLGNDPERISESGAVVTDTGDRGFAGYLTPIASLFASTEDILDILVRWAGPSLYRSHTFRLERCPDHKLRLTISLKEGYRPCLAFFQMIPGALRVVPNFTGAPDMVIEAATISSTEATFILVVAGSARRTVQSRLRQTWAALRSSRAISDELAFQQQQLESSIEALRRTEGGFRAALDALPAYVVLHRNGVIVYANPALASAVNTTARALLGSRLVELIHADDRERFARVSASVRSEPLTVRLIGGPTSRTIEVAALPAFDFAGARTAGLIAIDITARIRVEETLSLLHSSLPDLVVRIASDGCVLDVQGGIELGEQTRFLRTLVGTRDWAVASALPGAVADHLAQARRALVRALETGAEQRVELQAVLDVPRTYEMRVVPRVDGDEVLMLIRDVTAQRTAERQLAISERMASVGTLAAGVAHEINNPLTYVMAGHEELDHELAALAGGEAVDPAELRALLAEVRDGVGRIREIVAALRTFSRVEPGAAPVRLDPREAIQRALAMCGGELRHRATVQVDLAETPWVHADPSALIQVLVNLLINAAQAMPEDLRAERRVRVTSATDEAGRIRIEVHDTGVGIAPHHQQRIFDPFFTTKPVNQGTGLGLSISHRLVNELGGTITFTSELGKGSTFVVTLPAAPPEARTPPPVVDAPPSSRAQILIVDDEAMVAAALARVLTRDGHVCTTATSGAAALAQLRARPFDLVLCDLMMPGMTGMELYTQVVAEDPELAERFIFITGGAFTDSARALIEDHPRPVLPKPPDLPTLRQHVAKVVLRRDPKST